MAPLLSELLQHLFCPNGKLKKGFDKLTPMLQMPVSADDHEYITSHMTLLQSGLEEVNTMAAPGELPDVEISDRSVKVSPLDSCIPVQVSPRQSWFTVCYRALKSRKFPMR